MRARMNVRTLLHALMVLFVAPLFQSQASRNISAVQPTTIAASIAEDVEYLLERGHASLLVLFGVYPQKRKIHVLTNNDVDMLRREYKRYAKRDILRGEKHVIHIKLTDYEVHRYELSQTPASDCAARGGARSRFSGRRHNVLRQDSVEFRIADDGISHSKAKVIEHYGIVSGEWYWDKARSSAWYEFVQDVSF